MKTIPYLIALGIASLLVQACDKAGDEPATEPEVKVEPPPPVVQPPEGEPEVKLGQPQPLPPSWPTQQELHCNDTLPIGPPPKPFDPGCPWEGPEWVTDCYIDPVTYSLVNKTSVPIRIAYGPYDGACLPPQLPTDTYIAPGDSISGHLKMGRFTGVDGSLYFADQIFPSHHLMVIFNEERFVTHANPEDWCQRPSSKEGRDRNLFCGWDYAPTHWLDRPIRGFLSYTFTEADRQRAQTLPQR